MCHHYEITEHERELAYEPDEEDAEEREDLADREPAVPHADDD
ncbi:hypothetical protein [Halostella salina]|nr:hypothetical protein [Halostella salina]